MVRSQLWRRWWQIGADNLRYALRQMRRSPGLALAVVLSFALGIGVNATMFSIIDRLLLSPPAHVVDADQVRRLMVNRLIIETSARETVDLLSYLDYVDFTHARTLSSVAAIGFQPITLGRGMQAGQYHASLVTGNFFSLLAIKPAAGRFFDTAEDGPGAPGVAVISYGIWQREFGADRTVVGRSLDFGFGPYTIIGIAPKGFTGLDLRPVDVWLPLRSAGSRMMGPLWPNSRELNWLRVVARLAPGTSAESAEQEATALHAEGRAEQIGRGRYDSTARVVAASLITGRGPKAPSEFKVAAWLAGISLLVLIITCANVAGLLLARAIQQRRDVGVRLALGSTRGRVLGQVLTDGALLAVLGGLTALLLARWGGDLLRSILFPEIAWSASLLGIRVLGFVAVLVVFAGAAAGLIPAVQATRFDVIEALKATSRNTSSPASRSRDGLIILQAALSVVLLTGAGLFVRSLHRVNSLDLGLDPDRVLLVMPVFDGGTSTERMSEFMLSAAERLRGVPGVEHASMDVSVPFSSFMVAELRVPGLSTIPALPTGLPVLHAVDHDYFDVLRLTVHHGRRLLPQDNSKHAPRVVVVNETMARVLWPGRDAVGQCLIIKGNPAEQEEPPCATVVGVVENARRYLLIEGETMHYYVPVEQGFTDQDPTGLLVRVRGDVQAMIPAVQRELLSVERALRFVHVQRLNELIDPQARSWQLGASVFSAFGLLALIVAGIGLHSVLVFNAAQRTFELGIRAALGATRSRLLGLVVGQALRLVGIGVVLGLTIVIAVGPRLEPLLFGVSPRDPLTLAVVVTFLGVVGILASFGPARRATQVHPSVALRVE